MASNFLGTTRGKKDNDVGSVTVGTTTSAALDIEIRMDTGKNLTRKDVLLALELFEAYILNNGIGSGAAGAGIPPN